MVTDYSPKRTDHAIQLIRHCVAAQATLWNTQRMIERLYDAEFDMQDDIQCLCHHVDEPNEAFAIPTQEIVEVLIRWLEQHEDVDVRFLVNGLTDDDIAEAREIIARRA